MNIYIPIEVKARELESRSLLALEAASRGHKVIIGGKEDTIKLASKGIVQKGLVFDKSITDNQLDYINKIKDNGFLYTCQDEEHGLLDLSYDKFASLRFSDEALNLCDQIYAWGNHDINSLRKIYPKHEKKFNSTGSPRVDLWRKEFDKHYFKQNALTKPYILVISNFGRVMNSLRMWDIFDLNKNFLNEKVIDLKNFFEGFSFESKLVGEFLSMIESLSSSFPDYQIVVRPHPVEDERAWKIFLKGKGSNISVIKEGGISKWIRNSEAIIHNGCTSSLEATVSRIPVFTYRPILSEFERETPNLFGLEALSINELQDKLREYFSDIYSPDAFSRNLDFIDARFSNLEGDFAFKKIVDNWESLGAVFHQEKNPDEIFLTSLEKLKHNFRKRPALRGLYGFIVQKALKRKSLPTSNSLMFRHKFPNLSYKEVIEIKNKLIFINKEFEKVEICQFGERSVLLKIK